MQKDPHEHTEDLQDFEVLAKYNAQSLWACAKKYTAGTQDIYLEELVKEVAGAAPRGAVENNNSDALDQKKNPQDGDEDDDDIHIPEHLKDRAKAGNETKASQRRLSDAVPGATAYVVKSAEAATKKHQKEHSEKLRSGLNRVTKFLKQCSGKLQKRTTAEERKREEEAIKEADDEKKEELMEEKKRREAEEKLGCLYWTEQNFNAQRAKKRAQSRRSGSPNKLKALLNGSSKNNTLDNLNVDSDDEDDDDEEAGYGYGGGSPKDSSGNAVQRKSNYQLYYEASQCEHRYMGCDPKKVVEYTKGMKNMQAKHDMLTKQLDEAIAADDKEAEAKLQGEITALLAKFPSPPTPDDQMFHEHYKPWWLTGVAVNHPTRQVPDPVTGKRKHVIDPAGVSRIHNRHLIAEEDPLYALFQTLFFPDIFESSREVQRSEWTAERKELVMELVEHMYEVTWKETLLSELREKARFCIAQRSVEGYFNMLNQRPVLSVLKTTDKPRKFGVDDDEEEEKKTEEERQEEVKRARKEREMALRERRDPRIAKAPTNEQIGLRVMALYSDGLKPDQKGVEDNYYAVVLDEHGRCLERKILTFYKGSSKTMGSEMQLSNLPTGYAEFAALVRHYLPTSIMLGSALLRDVVKRRRHFEFILEKMRNTTDGLNEQTSGLGGTAIDMTIPITYYKDKNGNDDMNQQKQGDGWVSIQAEWDYQASCYMPKWLDGQGWVYFYEQSGMVTIDSQKEHLLNKQAPIRKDPDGKWVDEDPNDPSKEWGWINPEWTEKRKLDKERRAGKLSAEMFATKGGDDDRLFFQKNLGCHREWQPAIKISDLRVPDLCGRDSKRLRNTAPHLDADGISLESQMPPPFKIAMSMARYSQEPLAEILNLWHEDVRYNMLLEIGVTPYQALADKEKIVSELSSRIVDLVASLGVCLTRVKRCPNLTSMVQFLPGLGPRKAKVLLDYLPSFGVQRGRDGAGGFALLEEIMGRLFPEEEDVLSVYYMYRRDNEEDFSAMQENLAKKQNMVKAWQKFMPYTGEGWGPLFRLMEPKLAIERRQRRVARHMRAAEASRQEEIGLMSGHGTMGGMTPAVVNMDNEIDYLEEHEQPFCNNAYYPHDEWALDHVGVGAMYGDQGLIQNIRAAWNDQVNVRFNMNVVDWYQREFAMISHNDPNAYTLLSDDPHEMELKRGSSSVAHLMGTDPEVMNQKLPKSHAQRLLRRMGSASCVWANLKHFIRVDNAQTGFQRLHGMAGICEELLVVVQIFCAMYCATHLPPGLKVRFNKEETDWISVALDNAAYFNLKGWTGSDKVINVDMKDACDVKNVFFWDMDGQKDSTTKKVQVWLRDYVVPRLKAGGFIDRRAPYKGLTKREYFDLVPNVTGSLNVGQVVAARVDESAHDRKIKQKKKDEGAESDEEEESKGLKQIYDLVILDSENSRAVKGLLLPFDPHQHYAYKPGDKVKVMVQKTSYVSPGSYVASLRHDRGQEPFDGHDKANMPFVVCADYYDRLSLKPRKYHIPLVDYARDGRHVCPIYLGATEPRKEWGKSTHILTREEARLNADVAARDINVKRQEVNPKYGKAGARLPAIIPFNPEGRSEREKAIELRHRALLNRGIPLQVANGGQHAGVQRNIHHDLYIPKSNEELYEELAQMDDGAVLFRHSDTTGVLMAYYKYGPSEFQEREVIAADGTRTVARNRVIDPHTGRPRQDLQHWIRPIEIREEFDKAAGAGGRGGVLGDRLLVRVGGRDVSFSDLDEFCSRYVEGLKEKILDAKEHRKWDGRCNGALGQRQAVTFNGQPFPSSNTGLLEANKAELKAKCRHTPKEQLKVETKFQWDHRNPGRLLLIWCLTGGGFQPQVNTEHIDVDHDGFRIWNNLLLHNTKDPETRKEKEDEDDDPRISRQALKPFKTLDKLYRWFVKEGWSRERKLSQRWRAWLKHETEEKHAQLGVPSEVAGYGHWKHADVIAKDEEMKRKQLLDYHKYAAAGARGLHKDDMVAFDAEMPERRYHGENGNMRALGYDANGMLDEPPSMGSDFSHGSSLQRSTAGGYFQNSRGYANAT
ncbi:unnamed protein product, partial [Amoebophrya sp. A25]|eukprot:GSA25T00015000001.1